MSNSEAGIVAPKQEATLRLRTSVQKETNLPHTHGSQHGRALRNETTQGNSDPIKLRQKRSYLEIRGSSKPEDGGGLKWKTSRTNISKKVEGPKELYAESGQTLQGSFSAVSKPNFASKYSLELGSTKAVAEIYTMHSFAPFSTLKFMFV